MHSPYLPNSKTRQKKYVDSKKKKNPKLISFQEISEGSEVGNIFLDTQKSVANQDSRVELRKKKQLKDKKRKEINQLEIVDDQYIPQGQQTEQQFSILESIKLFIGVRSNIVTYPQKKVIFIDNNNEDENEQSKKRSRHLIQSQKGYSNSSSPNQNSLNPSSLLKYGLIIWKSLFKDLQNYFYVLILILSILQNSYSQNNSQYSTNFRIIIFIICFTFIFRLILFWFILSKKWINENEALFKVYHHNGVSAEWISLQANKIKKGNIYKVSQNSVIPTDSILIHSKRCMVAINQQNIKSYLSQKNSTNTIKETLIKAESIILPISGKLDIIINKDFNESWIQGKLDLEQPIQLSHKINSQNVILRGSANCSNQQILCMSIQTGVNSMNLKDFQYSLLQQKSCYNKENSQKNIIQNYIQTFIRSAIILYFLLSLTGLFIGYLTMNSKHSTFYFGSEVFSYKILLYHLTNFIIFIPILLRVTALTYTFIMVQVVQKSLSSLSLSDQLNNDKMSFSKVLIKDCSILPLVKNTNAVLTSIQCFRQQKAYQLYGIKVKDIKFILSKDNIQSQIYQKEQQELIKYFMSVSLLSTANLKNKNYKYQASLIHNVQQYFQIKITNNIQDHLIIHDQFDVCPALIVEQPYQSYYKLCFFYIPEEDSLKDQAKRALCIIRGNPQIILSKTQSRSSALQSQSKKLYQQQGHYVELLGKFSLLLQDVKYLKNMYQNGHKSKSQFYCWIQKNYFLRIQPMGLLIYNSQYNQHIFKNNNINQILNYNSLQANQDSQANSFIPMIIVSPEPSKDSLHPQFQAIHSITNLLIDKHLFNIPLKDVPNKILHDPLPVQDMIQKIVQQKIVIWNGWSKQVVSDMTFALKQASFQLCVYVQKDDQLYLSKKCSYCISNGKSGYDIGNYSDVIVQKVQQSKNKLGILMLFLKLIKIDSLIVEKSLFYLFLNQVLMFQCFLVVEVINLGYTYGTGLSAIRLPLYLLCIIIQLINILFYIQECKPVTNSQVKISYSSTLLLQTIKGLFLMCLGCLAIIYALQKPSTSDGTPIFNQFILLSIHFVIVHIIIFTKLFWTTSISIFKILIVFLQLFVYYIGIIIISEFSLYEFNGAIWYMFDGKQFVLILFIIWTFLALQFMKMGVIWHLQKIQKENQQYLPVRRLLNDKSDLNNIR